MELRVALIKSEEGYAVSRLALPGCHSQGVTREEALENIRDAIREWLLIDAEMNSDVEVTQETVTV